LIFVSYGKAQVIVVSGTGREFNAFRTANCRSSGTPLVAAGASDDDDHAGIGCSMAAATVWA
jgi:hypothetical protein